MYSNGDYSYLDPTIEYLYFEEKNEKPIIHLKFKEKEEIILNSSNRTE